MLKKEIGMIPLLLWLQVYMLAEFALFIFPWGAATKYEHLDLSTWEYSKSWSMWLLLLFVALLGGTRAYTQQLLLTTSPALCLGYCNNVIQMVVVYASIPCFNTIFNWQLWTGTALTIMSSLAYAYATAEAKAEATKEVLGKRPEARARARVKASQAKCGLLREGQEAAGDGDSEPTSTPRSAV